MNDSHAVVRTAGSAALVALLLSLLVLFVGMLCFGFDLTQWREDEGRWIGLMGTIAGVFGAVGGARIASRAAHRGTS